MNVCVVGVGVGNAKVKKPQVRIIYFADQNVTKDMIQYGVSKTITVKADIGAIELKKRLFDACVREWAKVNYGHVLVLEDLELVTANLVDILPPEDEEEPDETCMFLLLYTEDAKTGRIKFTRPKSPIQTFLKMTSKDFKTFLQYVAEKELEADFERKIGKDESLQASDSVRYLAILISVFVLTCCPI